MRLLLALLPLFALAAEPKPIRVLVWDEQQPQQSQGYGDKFLGETLAAGLADRPGLSVKTAKLADPEQGLSDAALDQADVLVFWCHRKVKEQDDARVEAIVKRVQAGKLGFIALHSAHWAKPFVRLMQERSKDDALKQLTAEERATAKWVFVNEAPYYKGVKAGAPSGRAARELFPEGEGHAGGDRGRGVGADAGGALEVAVHVAVIVGLQAKREDGVGGDAPVEL